MNKNLLFGTICILIFSTCKSGSSTTDPEESVIPVPPGFRLVWHDEFDDDKKQKKRKKRIVEYDPESGEMIVTRRRKREQDDWEDGF